MSWLFSIAVILGCLFLLFATIGAIKFPDFFVRMAGISKASTLGAGCLLMSTFIANPTVETFLRSIVALAFLYVSAPVAAHILGRGAYLRGVQLSSNTKPDEWKNHKE
jgi:multicomponent Na+:H+ antiporter subunit G